MDFIDRGKKRNHQQVLPQKCTILCRSVSPSKKNYDKDNDNYKNYKVNYIIDKDESDKKRVLDSVDTVKFFDDIEMEKIETELDGVVDDARMKKFKPHTVETTRLRLKYSINKIF